MKKWICALLLVPAISFAADEMKVIRLTIKDAKFIPTTLNVPSGEKFKLEVTNEGPGAEEFESTQLNREKVVPPGKTMTIFLGPLTRGEYTFFGDFHRDTANGKMIAK